MKSLHAFVFILVHYLIIGTFFTTILISCTDKCKNVVCQNGGICKMDPDGFGSYGSHPACYCAVGFEGVECETESRARLFGNYILYGTDNHGGVYSNLNTTIETSAQGRTKFILDVSGIFNLTCSMSSPQLTTTRFTIDHVTTSGFTYSGNGELKYTIPGHNLSLSVTKTDGLNDTVYTLGGLKQ